MHLVKVTWLDTGVSMGWKTPQQLVEWCDDDENFKITSLGFLAVDAPEWIVIVPTYSESGDMANPTRIQKGVIIDMEVLHYGKEAECDQADSDPA